MKQVFPAHTVKGGDSAQLARLEVLIQALVDDLRNGSNSHIWTTSHHTLIEQQIQYQ